MFFTIPLILLLVITYRKKKIIYCVVLVICTMFLVKGPLSWAYSVSYDENQTFGESIGLPMVILTDTYVSEPDDLPQNIKIIFDNLETDNGTLYDWNGIYSLGNYNSVKWYCDMVTPLKSIGISGILSATLHTVKNCPTVALRAVVELTDMVWTINGDVEGLVTPFQADGGSICNASTSLTSFFQKLHEMFTTFFNDFGFFSVFNISKLCNMIGFYTLMFVVATLFGYARHGLPALILTIPTLCYNLGTMLLLMGDDSRFFAFSTIIGLAIPIFTMLPWPTDKVTSD